MGSQTEKRKFPLTCPKCSQRFSVEAPVPGVMNDLRVTVAVAPHEKPIRCLNRGQEFQFFAEYAQISWGIIPLTDEQSEALRGSKIVVPEKSLLIQ